jgi:hypothetical protein
VKIGRTGLASARTTYGDEVVGTRDALVFRGREIPWQDIFAADWDSESETLTVVLVEPEVLTFELVDPALLLQLVRERITSSVVLTRRVLVETPLGFTMMARRPPGGGEISFTFEYDRGLDPDEHAVREAALQALREAHDELGIQFHGPAG